jgi:hypothetical protein
MSRGRCTKKKPDSSHKTTVTVANGHATSIFEYLTAKNPDLIYKEEENAIQSNCGTWIRPRYVRPWQEFSFETMERVFDGKLMEECRR